MGGGGLLLAGQGQRILHVAGNAVGFGHVFSGDAHVVLVVNVPQAVNDHAVDHLPVAHALAFAAAHQHVGAGAHVLLATGDDNFAVAPGHRLCGQHDCFEAGAADRVDGEGRRLFRNAALEQGLPCRVLTGTRRQHLPHDDLAHLVWRQASTLEQGLDDGCSQLRRRRLGQSATKFANRSAGG